MTRHDDGYTPAEAAKLARVILNEHGLRNVAVGFMNQKRVLGQATFRRGKPFMLELSEAWIPHIPRAEVEDTIRHEVAHLLCPREEGHGPVWRRMARKVGATPERCATLEPELHRRVHRANGAKWVGTCPVDGCDTEIYKYRMGEAMRAGRYVCRTHRERIEWSETREVEAS